MRTRSRQFGVFAKKCPFLSPLPALSALFPAPQIQSVPLELYFPDYKGGGDVESARAFMQEQFESKNRNPDKQIYTHVTCATDTHNIAAVFNAVKDIIIRKSLNEA